MSHTYLSSSLTRFGSLLHYTGGHTRLEILPASMQRVLGFLSLLHALNTRTREDLDYNDNKNNVHGYTFRGASSRSPFKVCGKQTMAFYSYTFGGGLLGYLTSLLIGVNKFQRGAGDTIDT